MLQKLLVILSSGLMIKAVGACETGFIEQSNGLKSLA